MVLHVHRKGSGLIYREDHAEVGTVCDVAATTISGTIGMRFRLLISGARLVSSHQARKPDLRTECAMLSETAKMILALGVPFGLAVAMLYAVLRTPDATRTSAKARALPAGAVSGLILAERADAKRRLQERERTQARVDQS